MAELWDLGDEQWTRDAATGRFEVVAYSGLGPPSPEWLPSDVGRLVGARFGRVRSPAETEIFPAAFERSPLTGAMLSPAAPPDSNSWLPPYGESESTDIEFLGLPRSAEPMVLDLHEYSPDDHQNTSAEVGLEPKDTLPLPGAGSYFFVVNRFGCATSTLVAVEHSKGLLFAWTPGTRKWVELAAKAEPLPESSLPREVWSAQLASFGVHGPPALVVPADAGAAVVSLDLLALNYTVTLKAGRCIGAPMLVGDTIAIPVAAAAGTHQLLMMNRRNPDDARCVELPPPLVGAANLIFTRAFADRRMAVWLSQAGQLIYRPAEIADKSRLNYAAWPTETEPRFEFGAPYLSTTGKLWQLCRNTKMLAYEYVLLGQQNPEVQPVQSPRLSTGGTVFHLETRLRGEPWYDSELDDAGARSLIIPLLESVTSRSVLRIRVEDGGLMSVARLLTSRDRYRVIFELDGQPGTRRFHIAQVSRPWMTEPFFFEGRLYLYHPDINSEIPGWALRQEK